MNFKTAALISLTLASASVFAAPMENISARKHPNLAAAQRLTDQAFQRVSAAQAANEFDMDAHAAKAKELLEQASNELKLAAEVANMKR